MSTHTKGPWTLGRSGRVVMGSDGWRVADCRVEDHGDEARDAANARLIAAAPELLALARLVNAEGDEDEIRAAARAALEKAGVK